MDAWWNNHGDIDLGEYSRSEVEGLTGKLPLLLESCTAGGVLDFSCDEVADVVRQLQRFVFRMRTTLDEKGWVA
jgi:hypothetical protein